MKIYLLFASICIALLQSCGTSSNVTSNFSIQKRKYNKGWNVKTLFHQKQSLNNLEESEAKQVPNENDPVSENKLETKTIPVTSSTPSSNYETIVDKEIVNESKILIDQQEPVLEETVLIQENEIDKPIENDEDPTENAISPELKKFNKYHKIMVILLFGALVTFLVSLFPLYVLLIIQRFKNYKKVPLEERDEYYYRKKIFAGVFFILGTILLTIALTMLVAALIIISM